MAVDDLWHLTKPGPDGERVKSGRYGRGRRWRVRYTDDAGQPKQKLFERKSDADRWDANVRADVSRGQYVDPRAGKVTVTQYGEQWRATQVHRESTVDRLERAFRLHVEPTTLGRLQLGQVRSSHVQGWVKDRSRELAPTTMAMLYSYIASMFTTAAIDRLIGVSPCQGINLPEVPRNQYVIPTPEQVHALADEMSGRFERYSALVYVGAGTGLRQGEAWGLELEHVNFLRRELYVRQQLVTVRGKTYLAAPKTATSARTVELGQITSEALARHIELYPPKEVEIEDRTDPRKPVARMAKLLFVNTQGRPLKTGPWSRPWVAAVSAVGLPEGFGFHGLRHYFATLLIHAGASVKTVQLALGHSTATITLNTYAHEWPDAVDRTRTIVDRALGRSAGTEAVS